MGIALIGTQRFYSAARLARVHCADFYWAAIEIDKTNQQPLITIPP